MTSTPHVLLLDDGELDDVASILDDDGVSYTRLRGGEIEQDIGPPSGLLVTSPRRAQVVRRGSPENAKPGRPVRIIAVEEDSNAMRRMLRQMGFDLLVRRPTHPEIWRLLIRRAIYQGDERRVDSRITVGSEVSLASSGAPMRAMLVDISNRGCRILSSEAIAAESPIAVEIPLEEGRAGNLVLHGVALRSKRDPDHSKELQHTTVMLFDTDMNSSAQIELARLLNHWSTGPSSIAAPPTDEWSLPARPSREQPNMTLDDETDPAIRANVEITFESRGGEGTMEASSGSTAGDSNRRRSPRSAFPQTVVAESQGSRVVLLGRDLSAGGMRVERGSGLSVGSHFKIALYGPTRPDRILVGATVVRDDGSDGLALRFDEVRDEIAVELEKLVACLPDVESLQSGEAAGLGSVVSEIVPESET